MVNYCCVVGCSSKSRDSKDPTAPTSRLFAFPKELSARWRLVTKQPAGIKKLPFPLSSNMDKFTITKNILRIF